MSIDAKFGHNQRKDGRSCWQTLTFSRVSNHPHGRRRSRREAVVARIAATEPPTSSFMNESNGTARVDSRWWSGVEWSVASRHVQVSDRDVPLTNMLASLPTPRPCHDVCSPERTGDGDMTDS